MMTNKEAIEHLKNINSRYPCSLDSTFRDECEQIAINLAIKALEEKPQGERAERALAIIDRLRTDGHINNKEQGTLRRAILLPERSQGEWIVTAEDNHGVHRICCPFCFYEKGSNNTDTIIVTFSNFPKFCENCGAKMKGGAE